MKVPYLKYSTMLKIRLARYGAKKKPVYAIMVANALSPRETGIEKLGRYEPLSDAPVKAVVNEERVKYWLSCGAKPTERVALLLSQLKVIPAVAIPNRPLKSAPKKKAQQRLKQETA